MGHLFEKRTVEKLDHTICKLESLGTILTHLTSMENQEPDLTALADLGRLISDQAMVGLDLLQEGTKITDEQRSEQFLSMVG